jgi:hypothetical protein
MKHTDYLDTLRGHSREEIAAAVSAAKSRVAESNPLDDPPPAPVPLDRSRAAVAEIDIQQPGGSTARFLIRLTEISKSGLGFLHGGYLHAGSRCRVTVTTPQGGRVTIPGVVQHGRCIRGRIHCFDVQFGAADESEADVHS